MKKTTTKNSLLATVFTLPLLHGDKTEPHPSVIPSEDPLCSLRLPLKMWKLAYIQCQTHCLLLLLKMQSVWLFVCLPVSLSLFCLCPNVEVGCHALKTSPLIIRMSFHALHWYAYPGYALLAVRCLVGTIAKIKKRGLAVPSIMPQAASHTSAGKELIVIYAHLSLSLFSLPIMC